MITNNNDIILPHSTKKEKNLHVVYDYFEVLNKDKVICRNGSCKNSIDDKNIMSQTTTVMKRHLQRIHKKLYDEMVKKEEEEPPVKKPKNDENKKQDKNQQNISDSFNFRVKYTKDSLRLNL